MRRSESMRRIEVAILSADLGVTVGQLKRDFLRGVNAALRLVGGPRVPSLDDEGALYRAMLRLEGEVG